MQGCGHWWWLPWPDFDEKVLTKYHPDDLSASWNRVLQYISSLSDRYLQSDRMQKWIISRWQLVESEDRAVRCQFVVLLKMSSQKLWSRIKYHSGWSDASWGEPRSRFQVFNNLNLQGCVRLGFRLNSCYIPVVKSSWQNPSVEEWTTVCVINLNPVRRWVWCRRVWWCDSWIDEFDPTSHSRPTYDTIPLYPQKKRRRKKRKSEIFVIRLSLSGVIQFMV